MAWPDWIKDSNMQWLVRSIIAIVGIIITIVIPFIIYRLTHRRGKNSSDRSVDKSISITSNAGETSPITIAQGKKTTINQSDPGLVAIVEKAVASLTKQLERQGGQLQQKDEQIGLLNKSITALAQQRSQTDSPSEIDAALAKLVEGETETAERIFQEIVDRKEVDIIEAASIYRHIGALAFLHDSNKALAVYRRSVELNPNSAEGWNQLGHLQARVGQLDEAKQAYEKVLSIGKTDGDRSLQATAYGNLGIIYKTRGDLEQAEEFWQESLSLFTGIGAKSKVKLLEGWLDSLKD